MADRDLDLPFEPTDPMPMADQSDAIVAGGLIVRAGAVDVPAGGKWPVLVWQFVAADGTFLQPLLLALPDDQMAKLRPLIFQAMAAARTAAKGGA